MPKDRSEVLQGTLDLMVLKTLDALGPLHGYGVARRLEQLSEELLRRGSIPSPGPGANNWPAKPRAGNASPA
jgi:hypothetical protein